MCSDCLAIALSLILASAALADASIYPVPKKLTDHKATMSIVEPCIVVGDKATETERYAADRLRTFISRRFHADVSVLKASDPVGAAATRIIIGLRGTNGALRSYCDRKLIDTTVNGKECGQDGFAIEVLPGENAVLVLGVNERGVVYGSLTLFQIMSADGLSLRVPVVSVRDYPSIPWRGTLHLASDSADDLDEQVLARCNFTRLTKTKTFKSWGDFRERVREAHKRGFFVYGARSMAVSPPEFDEVLADFEKLIGIGVDGIWMSFDDAGPGVKTGALMERVIALGKKHGITGRRIAITPPAGDYNTIDTAFNAERAKIVGMSGALWFFTRVPCAGDLRTARALGIKTPPAWWHNYPRVEGGLSNRWYGGGTMRAGGKKPYLEVCPLAWGWGQPNYHQIAGVPLHTDTVLACTGGAPMYRVAPLGLWAWNPEGHKFSLTREAVYDAAYGPACVSLMLRYDNIHQQLRSHFYHPSGGLGVEDRFPPRPLRSANEPETGKMIAQLEAISSEVTAKAPEGSMLPPEVLEADYLEPMRAEPAIARALMSAEFPEDWWPYCEGRLLEVSSSGSRAEAEKFAKEKGALLAGQLDSLGKSLGPLLDMEKYLAFWRQRAEAYSNGDLEKALVLFHDRARTFADVDEVALGVRELEADQPEGGTISAVSPEQLAAGISGGGSWAGGLYRKDEFRAVHFAFPPQTNSAAGDLCEVSFTLNVPRNHGPLRIEFPLGMDVSCPDVGYDRRYGVRYLQVSCGGEVIREDDLMSMGSGDLSWISAELPEAAGEVKCSIRVIDKVSFVAYPAQNTVGPDGETQGWHGADPQSYATSLMLGGVRLVEAPGAAGR
jgi:hypothetical protein